MARVIVSTAQAISRRDLLSNAALSSRQFAAVERPLLGRELTSASDAKPTSSMADVRLLEADSFLVLS